MGIFESDNVVAFVYFFIWHFCYLALWMCEQATYFSLLKQVLATTTKGLHRINVHAIWQCIFANGAD